MITLSTNKIRRTIVYPAMGETTIVSTDMRGTTIVYPAMAETTIVYLTMGGTTIVFPAMRRTTIVCPAMGDTTIVSPTMGGRRSSRSDGKRDHGFEQQQLRLSDSDQLTHKKRRLQDNDHLDERVDRRQDDGLIESIVVSTMTKTTIISTIDTGTIVVVGQRS